mmetsp:Transcript_40344/g.53116  ORF Transcript_40344/g.53116 Transcript_40344/m.53116 type:complete len:162 (+) Transcript_40344:50-535(+)
MEPECIDACLRVWQGLELTLRSAETAGAAFSVVIILAGTNDLSRVLGQQYSLDDVVNNLKRLHETAYSYNCRTVALTIPESFAEGRWKTAKEIRERINEEMREFADQSDGKTLLVDLATQLPYFDLLPEDRNQYWDDGLHLTKNGYSRMACIIHSTLHAWI